MNHKLKELDKVIEKEAHKLGLDFVSGPGSEPSDGPEASIGRTGSQERGVYLFAVAEKAAEVLA